MPAHKGRLVILKIGDGDAPEVFTTIGGFRNMRLELNNTVVEASNVTSGKWRKLVPEAGLSALVMSGSGIFTDEAAEETLRQIAFQNAARNFALHFGNGDFLHGLFMVTGYERAGVIGQEETFRLSLASAGEITYSAA